jgi:hypothetical protein
MKLVPGKGDEPDTLKDKTIYVYDTAQFPFYPGRSRVAAFAAFLLSSDDTKMYPSAQFCNLVNICYPSRSLC